MSEFETINGYRLTTGFTTAGAGRCQWAFAMKDGREYFLKKYNEPKYPGPSTPGSPASIAVMKEECRVFEERQMSLMEALRGKSVPGMGNLIVPVDFFREQSFYYKATIKVDTSSFAPKDIAALPWKDKWMIVKTLAHSLGILHGAGIVHGDLKPDNILVKKTPMGEYAAKLIDFDDSYKSGAPPAPEETVGDTVYYSPELWRYIEEDLDPADLTVASDIFALGLIIHQYFTGKVPAYDSAKYKGAYAAVYGGGSLGLDTKLNGNIKTFLAGMLQKDFKRRPGIKDVLEAAKVEFNVKPRDATPPVSSAPPSETGGRLSIFKAGTTGGEKKPDPAPVAPETGGRLSIFKGGTTGGEK